MGYRVDESCIGCGLCVVTCPAVFAMGDSGQAQAKAGEVPAEAAKLASEAAAQCPVHAIHQA